MTADASERAARASTPTRVHSKRRQAAATGQALTPAVDARADCNELLRRNLSRYRQPDQGRSPATTAAALGFSMWSAVMLSAAREVVAVGVVDLVGQA